VCYAAPVVFPVDFDGSDDVYRVHPINVQLVTAPVLMPGKEEHGCDSGSESLGKHEPRDIFIVMLKDVTKVSLLQKRKNERIKNIVSVFYGIPELSKSLSCLSDNRSGRCGQCVRPIKHLPDLHIFYNFN
jgi:hypothetical protein